MQNLAGHRLVRLLARGTAAELWLAVQDGSTTPVAIKLFHPATPLDRLDTEVEALGRISHRHVQRLLDIATDPHRRTCLVLERLGVSLARVLADRSALSAGEAVTVLAPVCEALSELHRVGVAHCRLDAGSILLDETGAPVLARFGTAQLVGEFPHPPQSSSLTPAEQAASSFFADDRDALARLAELVLRQAEGAETVLAWVQRQTSTPPGFVAELAERLYSLAPAAPIALPSAPVQRDETPLAIRPTSVELEALRVEADEPSAPVPFLSFLPPWLDERISAWRDRVSREWLGDSSLRDLTLRMRGAAKTVRPRLWVVAISAVAALLLALLLYGTGAAPEADAAPDPLAAEGSVAPSAQSGSEALPTPALPDDPVDAARLLLEHRHQCIRDLSVLCLDTTHQEGSAALGADRSAIISQQQGSPPANPVVGEGLDWVHADLSLVDELGDGALIEAAVPSAGATQPSISVMLLLVRTDDGWRIRDLFEWRRD